MLRLGIADTIKSAVNQTWPRKGIIVVNDGSTDQTLAVARQFASKDVAVVTQENQGASAARNHAFSLSQGDYISSQPDTQAAINASKAWGTVIIPNGSYTWFSGLTIAKPVRLSGQSKGGVTIGRDYIIGSAKPGYAEYPYAHPLRRTASAAPAPRSRTSAATATRGSK